MVNNLIQGNFATKIKNFLILRSLNKTLSNYLQQI